MNQNFILPDKLRNIFLGVFGLGLLFLIVGLLSAWDNPSRIFTAILYNSFFFLGISIIGLFFCAVHEIGFGGWMISVKRIAEAMSTFVPVAGIILLIAVLVGMHDIYHWTHSELYDPNSDQYDALLVKKTAFLNAGFFTVRSVFYIVLWIGLVWWFRRNSLRLDQTGSIETYRKSKMISAIFLVVFAITSSTCTWDWLMSIDPHWYSTLYGWYCFASIFVSGLCTIALIAMGLKSMGYLEYVNTEHIHDLGKMIFGFSIFWTYLWFSQYMLIWYGNIPEETLYFYERFNGGYKFLFFLVLFINFVFPFFTLITAGAKRTYGVMLFACPVILLGHWLDFYVLTMPGAVGTGNGIILELGIALCYVGFFCLWVFWQLQKAPLLQTTHPFVQESLYHHT